MLKGYWYNNSSRKSKGDSMDFNELKQDAEKLCKELKDKAPADLSVLVI